MASPDRPRSPLIERLLERPREFSFFQLVKLLKRETPGAVLPGGPGPAERENLRFRPSLGIGFPPGDIHELTSLDTDEETGEARRWRVEVNFMGLYGPSSPMPTHFSEEFLWAAAAGTEADAAREFVDLFHHRIISFVFRAWLKYRHDEQFDAKALDDFSRRMLCLLGLGTAGMEKGAQLAPLPLLRTAGLLADRHRSAAGLEQYLRAHLGLDTLRIRPCVESTAHVPRSQQLRLGRPSARLGDTAVLGEQMVDRAGTFRIEIGPTDVPSARRFLPGSPDLVKLVRLTRLYVHDPLKIELRLRIRAESVPPLRLTGRAQLGLGHLTWLSPGGRLEGQATVSLRPYDPLFEKRAAPMRTRLDDSSVRPAPAVTVRPASGSLQRRPTPRITSLRRP